ncbi:hypothetical protein PR048_015956 [Dryococelus australis]|uniref:Uncharacterized protein n=1 Tax=Dryococelus australis TaxID=614101 RepID=A0ABQ9HID6_9NEOP|nr:hypothetical protein PR048_015956 [Dryococelus australis]
MDAEVLRILTELEGREVRTLMNAVATANFIETDMLTSGGQGWIVLTNQTVHLEESSRKLTLKGTITLTIRIRRKIEYEATF